MSAEPQEVEFRLPGTQDREPWDIVATGQPGDWQFFSKHAMEIRWYPETPTPELIRRADAEWARQQAGKRQQDD